MKAVIKGNVNPTSSTKYSRNFPAFLLLFRLIDADPVDAHGLREDGGLVRTACPFAPNCDIEQQIKVLMKLGALTALNIGSRVALAIHIPLNLFAIPDNLKNMKVVRKASLFQLLGNRLELVMLAFTIRIMNVGFNHAIILRAIEF